MKSEKVQQHKYMPKRKLMYTWLPQAKQSMTTTAKTPVSPLKGFNAVTS
jgi:hypothetical protein